MRPVIRPIRRKLGSSIFQALNWRSSEGMPLTPFIQGALRLNSSTLSTWQNTTCLPSSRWRATWAASSPTATTWRVGEVRIACTISFS